MKKTFKSQASSGRAGFGASGFGGFGQSAFESRSSPLSYVYEPPALTNISNPHVVVQLKNLMKKDGKTKSRALEDLNTYLSDTEGEVEEELFSAYIKLYPRLSIDADRRVRQLAHVLVGHLVVKCGKRVVPYLSQIAGPWLCGQSDSDRATSRSAGEAFQKAFSTQEKAQNFRRVFHRHVVEYCRDAILSETPQTLSDTRSVSKEDADAIYHRVVVTALSQVTTFIIHLPQDELDKAEDVYSAIITNKATLELLSINDPLTRSTAIRFFKSCLENSSLSTHIDYSLTASVLFSKVLPSDQTTTAGDVLALLVSLTDQQPSLWLADKESKKSPDRRLRSFLKRGAQSSNAEYWEIMTQLFDRMPPEVLPSDLNSANEWMTALQEGVAQRQGPRHGASAWCSYIDVAHRFHLTLPETAQDPFVQEWIVPLLDQYFEPKEANVKWTIPLSKPESTIAKVAVHASFGRFVQPRWSVYTKALVEQMKLSQPEQSNDFHKSQTATINAARRWVAVQLAIVSGQHGSPDDMLQIVAGEIESISQAAIDLLASRRGKPYCAAFLLGELLRHQDRLLQSDASKDRLRNFLTDEAPELLLSPSQDQLISALYGVANSDLFKPIWNAWATSLTSLEKGNQEIMVKFLLASKTQLITELATQNDVVQNFLQAYLTSARGSSTDTARTKSLINLASDATIEEILSSSMEALSASDSEASALALIEELDQTRPGTLRSFAAGEAGANLLPQVVRLQQSAQEEDVAQRARQLHDRLLGVDGRPLSPTSSIGLIRRELQKASQTSLPISIVLDIAKSQLQHSSYEVTLLLQELEGPWQTALEPCSVCRPAPSLALMSPLGGTVHLVAGSDTPQRINTDSQGFSQALRVAVFTQPLLSQLPEGSLDARQEASLLSLLSCTALLADDSTNVYGSNGIWVRSTAQPSENMVVDFISATRKMVNQRLFAAGFDSELFAEYSDINLESVSSTGSLDFCRVRSFLLVRSEMLEESSISKQKLAELEEDIKTYRSDNKTLALCTAVALASPSLGQSTYLQRFFNELVADLTGVAAAEDATVLRNLVILNLIIQDQQELGQIIQKHRLVKLIQQFILWLADKKVPAEYRAEMATSLRCLTPSVADMYGEHWSQMLSAVAAIWHTGYYSPRLDQRQLCLVFSTLRLHTALQLLTYKTDPNEDLLDAFKEQKLDLDSGIVALITTDGRDRADSSIVPLQIAENLIARKASKIGKISDADVENLWPQLDSRSRSVQTAAFGLLREYIDDNQEQISFDAALEKKIAHLPEQLLSLILDAPDMEAILSAPFEEDMPSSLQTYLLSWLLVFAHFNKASAKVRENYVEDIRSSDHLPPLLELIYEFLGFNGGKPVDASKFDSTTYSFSAGQTPEKEAQGLLIHLYYLALIHLSTLTKQHYLSQSNRTLSNNIATWTAKHISPPVIASLFAKVTEWSNTFSTDPDYENFSLKISPKSREVTATYLIDEQPMSILVALPESYPLTGASVTGLSRAALDPKKWQSWLRGCQGVIQFSNGDLVDALRSWRTNVNGALAGQTECAICYSIISGDKQLPTKRCSTCKNLFHNSCLFKWFRTSNSSKCPLCRQAWSYNG